MSVIPTWYQPRRMPPDVGGRRLEEKTGGGDIDPSLGVVRVHLRQSPGELCAELARKLVVAPKLELKGLPRNRDRLLEVAEAVGQPEANTLRARGDRLSAFMVRMSIGTGRLMTSS